MRQNRHQERFEKLVDYFMKREGGEDGRRPKAKEKGKEGVRVTVRRQLHHAVLYLPGLWGLWG